MRGVSGRAEYPLTRYVNLLAAATYDNVQYTTFGMGLKVTFGGNAPGSNNLSNHLKDPITRYLVTVNSSGSGMPSQQITQTTGSGQSSISNIWFFSSDGEDPSTVTNDSCTAESPCAFNQDTLDGVTALATDPYIYIAYSSSDYTLGNTAISIPDGFALQGRSADFTQAASSGSFPTLRGSLDMGNDTSLANLTVLNDSDYSFDQLINISGVDNVTLSNVVIGGTNADDGVGTAVEIADSTDVTIDSSTINAYVPDPASPTVTLYGQAIEVSGVGTTATVTDNTINVTTDTITNVTGSLRVQGIGLGTNGTADGITLNASNNIISVIATAQNATEPHIAALAGYDFENTNTITFNDNTATVTTNFTNSGLPATIATSGILLRGLNVGSIVSLEAERNIFNITSTATTSAFFTLIDTNALSLITSAESTTLNATFSDNEITETLTFTNTGMGIAANTATGVTVNNSGVAPPLPSIALTMENNIFDLTASNGGGIVSNTVIGIRGSAPFAGASTIITYTDNAFTLTAGTETDTDTGTITLVDGGGNTFTHS